MTWDKLWERKTKAFRVVLDCTQEPEPDLSWDEDGETQAKINAGEWGCYLFRVTVYDASGADIGSDHLGNSVYADPQDFAKERGGYFSDMIGEACREARKFYNQPRAFLRQV